MTLEEVIRQRLAEATKETETTTPVVEAKIEDKSKVDPEAVGATDEVDTKPKVKKEITKESVPTQVADLLESEGLSAEFKESAVTIFEAAVTDRVIQIEENLKKEFDSQLVEAKEELDNDIDGFLSEVVSKWKQDNEVAIKSNFKTQLAESFIDGLKALIAEHNIDVPQDKEDALAVALSEVDKLNESIAAANAEKQSLQEQINTLKAGQILESFKTKMAQTEFDRFEQLTESINFVDETQYTKQLNIVLENFGAKSKTITPVVESVIEVPTTIVTESNSDVNVYANYITKQNR